MVVDRKQQLNWYVCPFNVCFNQEILVDQIRAGGICVKMWETVKNTLKGRGKKKRGRNTKILQSGGGGDKVGQEVGALKRGTGMWRLGALTRLSFYEG